MSAVPDSYFATSPRGLADLLARELTACGAVRAIERPSGVQFEGDIEVGYRACLWSRVASRVLLRLFEAEAPDADAFYRGALEFEWEAHVDAQRTLACEFTGSHPTITNTHFGALRLKDAVCDRLRRVCGTRPSVARSRPAVSLSAHAHGQRVTVYLDLAGEGLHRRGYRLEGAAAPLRENLAAGVLLRARWPEQAGLAAEFLDPMCGSGTLAIEAALIAAHRAPALLRDYFGFLGWKRHDAELWRSLIEEARAARVSKVASLIRGSDIDAQALSHAEANAARAQATQWVRFERCALADVRPASSGVGLICTNPPYGERLGAVAEAQAAHRELGRVLRERFSGWEAAVLTALPEPSGALRLRSYRVHQLWNGPIACRLLRIDLASPGSEDVRSRAQTDGPDALDTPHNPDAPHAPSPGAQMFANRLKKNVQRLDREARRAAVDCYRLYDADMPEYAFAIDRYREAASGAIHLYVQEYAPPATIDAQAARRRRQEALAVLPQTLQVPGERIHLRVRRRQRGGTASHQAPDGELRIGAATRGFVVQEAGLSFRVDLDDHLDTGLFLDHRLTRARIRDRARDARFLNLFCYTATASVYAAAGGARSTVSVDLSRQSLHRAADNLGLNGLDPDRHRLVRADCRAWLEQAVQTAQAGGASRHEPPFDLIFLDPPTFSNSKRMQGVLDIQRDHPTLIAQCMQLLAPQGLLLFSTNSQRFRLDADVERRWQVVDISKATLPFDFVRNPRIHCCFEIRSA